MKFYTVYKTINKINGKYYIGKHETSNPNDDYLGSGRELKQDIIKYGKENFEKTIIAVFDNEKEMNKSEKEIANREIVLDENSYNLMVGGGGFDFLNNGSDVHIERCKKGYILSQKSMKEKYGENFKSIIGQMGGKKGYDVGLSKWSKSDDPEIKKRRSKNSGNSFREKHHTEETKQKMKKRMTGKKNPMSCRCWVHLDCKEQNKVILKNELETYISNGWEKGIKQKYHNNK